MGMTSREKGSGFGLTILESTTHTGTWVSLTSDNRHSITLEVEDCLEINFVALEYWNDEPCCSKRPFICQFW